MHHIYTGDGKGKTTAAVGLAVRCAGSGRRVLFTQFLKPAKSGEIEAMEDMENMQIWLCPAEFGFTWQMTDEEKEEAKDIYMGYYPNGFTGEFLYACDGRSDWCMQCRTCE